MPKANSKINFSTSLVFSASVMLSSCAFLHHVQVGEIDNNPKFALRPFELKVSETGVNFEEAGKVVQALNGSKVGREDAGNAVAFIQLFQQGPRTGNPVFNESYAKNIVNDLYKECPTGRITGVVSIREMRKYPVISGEIIKIKGYCMLPRGTAKTESSQSTTPSSKSLAKSSITEETL